MAKVILRLEVDQEVLSQYQKQANKLGRTVEDVLSDRLVACQKHTAEKPLYITDEQRRVLEKYLTKNLSTPHALVMEVEHLTRINIAGTRINLPPPLLQRVESRCYGRKYPEVLREQVVEGLERFAGIR